MKHVFIICTAAFTQLLSIAPTAPAQNNPRPTGANDRHAQR